MGGLRPFRFAFGPCEPKSIHRWISGLATFAVGSTPMKTANGPALALRTVWECEATILEPHGPKLGAVSDRPVADLSEYRGVDGAWREPVSRHLRDER